MKNKLVSKLPIACFYYKGAHSHPVRRTVFITKETKDKIVGYELREGNQVRSLQNVKNFEKIYLKSDIARWGDYARLMDSSKNCMNDPSRTTLTRHPMSALFTNQV